MEEHKNSTDKRIFQHRGHRLPVTALAFFSADVLLSGEGNYLCAYDVDSGKCLLTATVFTSQAIHGINIISDLILIHGGRYLRLASLKIEHGAVDVNFGKIIELDDWILSVAIRPIEDGQPQQAGIVTAHDALHILAVETDTSSEQLTSTDVYLALAGERTILYSAHITWQTRQHILVVSGTAFGDVIVWSYHMSSGETSQHDNQARRQVHYNFSAHEGSIFDVRFSPAWIGHLLPDTPRLLLSCSDDRTIRLWNITDLPTHQLTDGLPSRDTGFSTEEKATEFRPPMLTKVMGHQSRIWHVRFMHSAKYDLLVQSFGEDATSLIWDMIANTASDEHKFILSLRDTVALHHGKHIWSVAHAEQDFATGGSDGAIVLSKDFEESTSAPKAMAINIGEKKDPFRSYALIVQDSLVATTSSGQVLVAKLLPDGYKVVTTYDMPALRGFSIVESAGDVALIGGNGSMLYIYAAASNTLSTLSIEPGKTAGLYANRMKSVSSHAGPAEISLLTTKVTSSTASMRILQSLDGLMSIRYTAHLALPAQEVVTSSHQTYIDERTIVTLLGCRNGLMLVYLLNTNDLLASEKSAIISYQQHAEAITSISWQAGRARIGYIFTTGRDGTYAIQSLSFDDHTNPQITLLHQLELPFGPNIEGLHVCEDQNVLIWGFQSKHFLVYSATKQQDVFKIECGGAHRNWSFTPNNTNDGGMFVWTKASNVFYHQQVSSKHTLFNAGGHGREIKSTAISSGHPRLLATGAEDTDIRLYLLKDAASANAARSCLECAQILRKHNTGPQHLAFSKSGQHLFSSGGFEELFIWRITYDCPGVGIGVCLESAHPRSGSSDLRIATFNVTEHDDYLEFILAYSDSSIGIWSYGEQKQGQWLQKVRAEYLTSVPTHITCFSSHAMTRSMITSSTDGHLISWMQQYGDGQQSLSWQNRRQIHQSAVLSAYELVSLPDQSTLMVTGGDDNAISVSRLSQSDAELFGNVTNRDAHAAAVTALLGQTQFTYDEGNSEQFYIYILSAGLDQRLIVWRLQADLSDTTMKNATLTKAMSLHTNVADVSGLVTAQDTWRARESIQVVITGIGIEVLKISLS